ncbi:hypothetical protein OGATHE_001181 [Ogataea polymorpha]|uniref:Uncharacterized protein n=1 Tax=Ogataea polymorpha TaxID=460523 RepID=A0A9P8PSB5_9ASCO|nr:hypothetical protein OGATHE_001181 [Ogataea polymorpha]
MEPSLSGNLGNVLKQVNNSGRVAVLIVIPGNELDEGWGQQDTGLGVEDRGSGVGHEVGRNDCLVGVSKDSSQWALSSLLHGGANVLVGGWLLEVDGQVNNRNIGGWDSHGHTSELTGQCRKDLSDSLGSTSRGWDDVTGSGSTTSPVLVGWTVNSLLSSGDGVNSGHQTFLNSVGVVDNLGHWCQAVGGTRSVRQNLDVWSVLLVVHTHNEHWSILRWSSDDDLLGTSINVLLSALQGGENSGRVQNVVDALLTPWDVCWVSLLENLNLLAVNDQVLTLVGNSSLELSVCRVVLEHVSGVIRSNEWIIDGNDVDVVSAQGNSQHQSTNSSKSINSNVCGHFVSILSLY